MGSRLSNYRSYSKYLDRQSGANSVNRRNAASDQGPRCLPLTQQFHTLSQVVKMGHFEEM